MKVYDIHFWETAYNQCNGQSMELYLVVYSIDFSGSPRNQAWIEVNNLVLANIVLEL